MTYNVNQPASIMAHCFQLISKASNDAIPLNTIDKEVCELIDVPIHTKWYGGGVTDWFNSICTFCKPLDDQELAEIVYEIEGDKGLLVLNYLKQNYTIRHWRESGFA